MVGSVTRCVRFQHDDGPYRPTEGHNNGSGGGKRRRGCGGGLKSEHGDICGVTHNTKGDRACMYIYVCMTGWWWSS